MTDEVIERKKKKKKSRIEILFLNHFKKFIIETSRKFLDIKKIQIK